MLEQQRAAQVIRDRLRNPSNAVPDIGIDLKRKVIPQMQVVRSCDDDAFGPIIPTEDDVAFGPLLVPRGPDPFKPKITVAGVQRMVCSHYGIPPVDLVSSRRTADVVRPRQIAMYLCRKLTPRSLPEIGRLFGNRDHTTCLHAIRKIESMIAADEKFKDEIYRLVAQFE